MPNDFHREEAYGISLKTLSISTFERKKRCPNSWMKEIAFLLKYT